MTTDNANPTSRYHENRTYRAVSARHEMCVCGAEFMAHYNGRCPKTDDEIETELRRRFAIVR